jgi:thiol-disulfide isomerase/thioredoxin
MPACGRAVIPIRIYTRPGCHLCDDMKATVQEVVRAAGVPVEIEEVDISTEPELEARYGLEIPVLFVRGKKAAKYRVSREDLRRILDRPAATSP